MATKNSRVVAKKKIIKNDDEERDGRDKTKAKTKKRQRTNLNQLKVDRDKNESQKRQRKNLGEFSLRSINLEPTTRKLHTESFRLQEQNRTMSLNTLKTQDITS